MKIRLLAAAAAALILALPASADVKTVHAELVKHLPGLTLDQIRPAPIAGWFEVTFSDGAAYVSADGKYLIRGDLYEVATRTNVTQSQHNESRLAAMKELDDRQTILFAPPSPKHTITVFTDVECGYCRKLHSQIAKYNEAGIAVRYAAFPRGGPGTEAWKTMEAVWCSKDRADAMTRAKLGEKIERPADCKETSVAKQYALGGKIGTRGTPTIVLEDGAAIGGYLSPEELAKRLDQRPQAVAASH